MGVGSGLYMYDVVVKRSRSLSHLPMSSCKFFVPSKIPLERLKPGVHVDRSKSQPTDNRPPITREGGIPA